jgi:hypothetical protein
LKHLILIVFFFAISCGPTQNSGTSELLPFEINITSYDFAAAYGLQYLLTNKELKIIFKGELEGERDTILFSISLEPNEKLRTLGNLNLDSLKDYYENPCIDDGSQISVEIKKNNKQKNIHLSNYFHQDIGLAIEIVNSLTPKDFKIWYDQEKLTKRLIDCESTLTEPELEEGGINSTNLFDSDSKFEFSIHGRYSDYPSSDPDTSYCSKWNLTDQDIQRILTKTTRISGQEWHILFGHYPCVYRGTLSQNEIEFKFEINGGSWLTITSDTTVFYADLGATLSELFIHEAWKEDE